VFGAACEILIEEQAAFTVTVDVTVAGVQPVVVLYVHLFRRLNQLGDDDCVGMAVVSDIIGVSRCSNARRRW
jgi:hypothetical protein